MNCFGAYVSYSTHAPQSEIDRLTDFDFSCFTRIHKCKWLGDLLPAAWEWRLDPYFEPGRTLQMEIPSPPRPCDISIRALGRDYNSVFAVQAISTSQQKEWDGPHRVDRARIISTLKGPSWRNGLVLDVDAFSEGPGDSSTAIRERLTPGNHYVLIYEDPFDDPPGPFLTLDRCGVQEDSPEIRRELEKGFAENDALSGPELKRCRAFLSRECITVYSSPTTALACRGRGERNVKLTSGPQERSRRRRGRCGCGWRVVLRPG